MKFVILLIKAFHLINIVLDPDANPDELEEKQRLINQVMELQNTLDGMKLFPHHVTLLYYTS